MRDRDLWATDEVYKLVAAGASFRDAYLKVKEEMGKDTRADGGVVEVRTNVVGEKGQGS